MDQRSGAIASPSSQPVNPATASQENTTSSQQAAEHLTCTICYFPFDERLRRPLDLGCGHCFCEHCYRTSPGSFRNCPECRERCRNPHISISLLRVVSQLQPSIGPPSGADAQPAAQTNTSSTSTLSRFRRQLPNTTASPSHSTRFEPPPSRLPVPDTAALQRVRGSLWNQLLPWLALLYAISPLDLIPDVVPLIGWLDDLLVILFVLYSAYYSYKCATQPPRSE